MKLKLDCIRDVMIEVEKLHKIAVDEENNITFEILWIEELYEALSKHSKEDIFYAVFNLGQAGYLDVFTSDGNDSFVACAVNYMTYEGHEFLEKIRDAKQWKAVKGVLAAIRNYSLDAINQAANGATTAALTVALSKLNLDAGFPVIGE